MGELKTIISANIPVSLAQRLKGKTKGTRSRVIARALRAYLDDKESFTMADIETKEIAAHLMNRIMRENDWKHNELTFALLQLINREGDLQ